MNTIKQSSIDHALDQAKLPHPEETCAQNLLDENPNEVSLSDGKIGGYDGGNLTFFTEPSFCLSLVTVFVATYVCLGKTPVLFWSAFMGLSALTTAFHIVAERRLFRAKKELNACAPPFDGIFVITFGSILPGIALLGYGIYSLSSSTAKSNIPEELGKLALLLIVPLFNFYVWSAVRKKYLIRPRLVGVMNGLALGLSVSWMLIWLKLLFLHGDVTCKFGWLLLLLTSPFLFFAAACLSFDLWRKVEPSIARITTTYSVLGGLLSMLFVFTPMARAFYVQSTLTDAKYATGIKQTKALATIRALATDEDLLPSRHPVSGFALAELLIPSRGLDDATDRARDLYFKITGTPFASTADEQAEQSSNVGAVVPGLSLAKSQMSGFIDAATLSSSIDWSFTFHNSTSETQEVRAEICLPKKSVVSRATLWIDGSPRDAAVGPTARTRQAYESVVDRKRDPLLVTMSAPDRLLIQCFPLTPIDGEMKIRIGFKVPLETADTKTCSMQLPALLSSNFGQPKRHRFSFSTKDAPVLGLPGVVVQKNPTGYSLAGVIKATDGKKVSSSLKVQRSTQGEIATSDWYSKNRRYIVQQLKEVATVAPNHLFVVLDQSASLKDDCAQIKKALSTIPSNFQPLVYCVKEQDPDEVVKVADTMKQSSGTEAQAETLPKSVKEAQNSIEPDAFIGGQDNRSALREALETAAEQPGNAVLWIHGPQPLTQSTKESMPLDLMRSVRLYDLQIGTGQNSILPAVQKDDVSKRLNCETVPHQDSISKDLSQLMSNWQIGKKRLAVQRKMVAHARQSKVVTDRTISAQSTCLWANEEVSRLIASGHEQDAEDLAVRYQLVTPLTGAVVLENLKEYKMHKLDGAAFIASRQRTHSGAFVGSPVNPRYGQSNEVGQLSDFGYDTARDISRVLTGSSFLVALIVAGFFLRAGSALTGTRIIKTIALVVVVPVVVHTCGTFAINNYGGLGGGL